ncbi:MAG: hypothetical protein QHI48_12215 [Bacteroidota bacterium]|nr:hypothetical protein [Bacteroidota bacterium]
MGKYLSLAIVSAAFACLVSTVRAQWIEDSTVDADIRRGIRAVYNLDFGTAEKAFTVVARARPDHPAGIFFLAMVDWWKITIDVEDESKDAAFVRKLEDVIALCDRRLERDENDLAALFFKGGAVGFRGRLATVRKNWFRAAADGREALPIVHRAAKLAPRNADIHFGIGIYNYYAAVLPDRYPLLKPLMLFLPDGNRQLGIRQLQHAAEKGKYANWESMYFLVQVLSTYENKPSSSLPYARRLSGEFPKNPVFQRLLGRIYIRLSDWRRAVPVFRKVLEQCDAHAPGYGRAAEREAAYYLGENALLRYDAEGAIPYFKRCVSAAQAMESDEASGFRIMALLKTGNAYDILGKRPEALRYYDMVLAQRNHNSSHELARAYRAKPYSR